MKKYLATMFFILHGVLGAASSLELKLPKSTLIQWHPVFHVGNATQQLLELVPPGEKISDWSRMLTLEYEAFSYVRSDSIDIRLFMQKRLEQIRKHCKNLSVNLVEQSAHTLVYWWSVKGCQSQKVSEASNSKHLLRDQHELVKLVRGKRGYNMLRYTRKGRQLSQADISDMWQVAQSAKTSQGLV